jgi:predicted regulator of Ras-like GTPase activity (Roadblock/LC7/MglB family)
MEAADPTSASSTAIKTRFGSVMQEALSGLIAKVPGVLAAQVCSSDGFEVASVRRDAESHRRLAAMVSSLQALGSAMVEETETGRYVNLIVEATNGRCLMMSIPGSNDTLLLTAVASPEVLFGRFHLSCKACAEALGACLTRQGAA